MAANGSPALSFPMPESSAQGFVCALTELGVIAATGLDAASFLHNQLTNEVQGLDTHHAHLAGYCSPKGRLLATLLVWKSKDTIYLALPKDLIASTLKRLQMFVLRSKVVLSDVSDAMVMIGSAQMRALESPVWSLQMSEAGSRIQLPAAGALQRQLWVGSSEAAPAYWEQQTQQLPAAPSSLWRWSEIIAGLPQVVESTREQFVPQMINFELVGGVNFRKGCYPGQEVVARSQYLGKQKRRMLLAVCDAPEAHAGDEVFAAADPDQPCGMVVNAEHGPNGQLNCLVAIKLEAAQGAVSLGSAEGAALRFIDLPYALPDPA